MSSPPVDTAQSGVDAGGGPCSAVQLRPDGSCCEAGAFFATETSTCEPVGPPECSDVALDDPASCVPRWCWDWELPGGAPCEPGAFECRPRGRSCTDDERRADLGCPAGMAPEPLVPGLCVIAGLDQTSGDAPYAGELPPVPPLPPLEASVPRLCWDLWLPSGAPCAPDDAGCRPVGRPCTEAEQAAGAGCPPGTGPFLTAAGCAPVGLRDESVEWAGPADELPPLPPLPPLEDSIPAGVPPLTELPPLTETRFCLDVATGAARFCTAVDTACASAVAGEPDPDGCLTAGVPWLCPPGFVEEPGSGGQGGLAACAPDPADCGAGPYAAGLGPGAIFVDASAAAGGDGSEAAPFASIADALVVVPEGGTVALAAGTYSGVELSVPLTLAGRCAAMVTILGSGGQTAVSVKSTSADRVIVRGVKLTGDAPGATVTEGGKLRLERVWIEKALGMGLHAASPSTVLELVDGVISGTQAGGNGQGDGLVASDGASVSLTDVRLTGNRGSGALFEGAGTKAAASALLVDGTLSDANQHNGIGVVITSGAELSLSRARLSGNRTLGLLVMGAGTSADVTALLVDGTLPQESDQGFGLGVEAHTGAHLSLSASRLSGNRTIGLLAEQPGATIVATGLLVDGTLPMASDLRYGRGAQARSGAALSLSSVRLSGNRNVGLYADGETRVDATGLLIDGTLPRQSDQATGRGVHVQGGAALALAAARLSGNREIGLLLGESGTEVEATGLLVDGTLPQQSDQLFGRGIQVYSGAALALSAARLSGNRDSGLSAEKGGSVDASSLLVDGSAQQEGSQVPGHGIQISTGATLSLFGSRLSGNRAGGLVAVGAGTKVLATNLLVEGMAEDEESSGTGVEATTGAELSLTGARLSRTRNLGLLASDGGTSVHAAGVLVDDTLPGEEEQQSGRGVGAVAGARLSITAMRLSGNREAGLFVSGEGTETDGAGLLIDGTLPRQRDLELGVGVVAQSGAVVSLSETRLSGNRTVGLFAEDAGTKVSVAGLLVDGTLPQESDPVDGYGISVQGGAALSLSAARLSGNRAMGLYAGDEGTSADAVGLLVDGTLSQASNQDGGHGIVAQAGAAVRLSAARVSGNRVVGLFVGGSNTTVNGAGLLVDGTLPRGLDQRGGYGIGVHFGGALSLAGALVSGNRMVGLFASDGGTRVRATGLRVEGTLVQQSDQHNGAGVWALDDASVELGSCLLIGNRSAGAAFERASGSLEGCVVAGTTLAALSKTRPGAVATDELLQVGDGVVSVASPVVIKRSLLAGNQRAGLIVSATEDVTVRSTAISGSVFGLDLEEGAELPLDAVLMHDNQHDRSTAGGLSLPEPPEFAGPPPPATSPDVLSP